MATKHAGMGAAFVALAIVLGLLTLIGVILLMMWFQPGIEHSPSEHGSIRDFRRVLVAHIANPSTLVRGPAARFGAKP